MVQFYSSKRATPTQAENIRRDYRNDPRNALAQAMMSEGLQTTPIQSHWQGLNRVAQAALGGYMMNKQREDMQAALEQDKAQRMEAQSALASALSGYDPSQRQVMTPPDGLGGPSPSVPVSPYAGALSAMQGMEGNPYAAEQAQQLGLMNFDWQRQQEADRLARSEASRMQAEERAYNDQQYKQRLAGQKELAQFEAGLAAPKDTRTGSQKDYEYAVSNGFQGSFNDFLMSKAAAQGGYMYTPASQTEAGTGQMTPIPGSEADIKAKEIEAAANESFKIAKNALSGLQQQTEIVNKTVDEAIKLISPWSTGYGSYLSVLPETEAGALENALTTLKANIGFDKLQRMREASPTGGALGSVSENENRLLQAVNGALDPKQRDQLERNLKSIKELYGVVLKEKQDQFNSDFSGASAQQDQSDPLGLRQ